MYISFMSCHDPKGVVECKPFRKYRTCSQKRKDQKTTENSETSLMRRRHKECTVPKGSSCGNFIAPSSLHLIQVSKGGLIKYDGRSEDTAKGLLIALHELHEASQSNPKRFQRPQVSADGFSSICTKELEKAIKEGLVSQNMFSITTTEGLDSASETTSTRSKMENRSNLVAKLMGLEEAPSRSFASVKKKHIDCEKIMNEKRPLIQMNLPEERKSNSIEEKVINTEQKALRETLDTVHFRGTLKKNSVKEPKLQVHHYNDYDPNSKHFDDSSHIVRTKARCTIYQESIKTQTRVTPEESSLSMSKLRAEVVSSRAIRQRKGTNSINIGKEMEKDACKQLTKEKGLRFLKEVMKPDAKGIDPIEESPNKVKLYCQVSHRPHVNEKTDKKCKAQTISRQLPEQDISEPKIDDCKDLNIEIKESDSVFMKNQSPVAVTEAEKPIAVHIELEEDKKSINVPSKDDYAEQVDEMIMVEWEEDANTNKYKAREAARESTNCSESFIGEAKNLLNSDEDYHSKVLQEDDETNWMANLSLQESQIVHSFLQNFAEDSRLHISSGMLVEQIYDANESLKNSGDKHFADNVFAITEKDIKCNEVVNGGSIWEQGWWCGFSADETELVVNEVERLLVTGLIEEVIINLL